MIKVSSVSETLVEVQFEQLQLDNRVMSYYYYTAEWKEYNKTFMSLNNSILEHNSSVDLVSFSVTGLKSGTDYAIRIVPYREISHSSFSNQGREAGVPSMEANFITGM